MGIGDFLKRGVAEMMVARPDEAKDVIVYKHPDRTIPWKAQLTVDQDEVALFFKDGTIQGIVQPGRHTLETANIPFLSNLIDKFTGGNVLMAEVWFVSMREIASLKFGGRIGELEDPKSGMFAAVMVHGTYSMRVTDPQKLLLGLVGMKVDDDNGFMRWFRDQLMKIAKDRIAELMVKKKWPLLDVTSGAFTEEIEQDILAGIKAHVDDYGLSILRLGKLEISISEEDAAEIKKLYKEAAYIRMVGGMQGYQQYAGAKAMMGAGEGMAKGGGEGGGGGALLGGAGLGVGFGMAQMFGNQMGGAGQGQAQGGQLGGQQAGYMQGAGGAPGGAGQMHGAATAQGAAGAAVGSGVACGACGTTVAAGKFCASCGAPLTVAKKFCRQCGNELAGDAKFCSGCGTGS
jgi:membrane protease subunit (stomatin/prohibitin family)